MSNQIIKQDDDDLVYFFKHFETILATKKPDIEGLSEAIDFQLFTKYLTNDIRKIKRQLNDTDDEYLLYTCRHVFNILDWIKLIAENRSQIFSDAIERVFAKEFEDKHILLNIYRANFEKWITNNSGQHTIGANTYSVLKNNLYNRDRFGQWFKIDKDTAFDLKPNKELIEDTTIIQQLDREYKETSSDTLIKEWEHKDYQSVLPDDFLRFENEMTSPEEYFEFTLDHIKSLLSSPVSIKELERWNGGRIVDLEQTIKLCSMTLDIVKDRRKDNSHTVYLLRDCMVFYEIHKTLDILSSVETSSDQLLIGRKLLSHKPGQWGYYIVILEVLYEAHKRYPDNFTKFYNEFERLLDLFASVNPEFMTVVNNIVDYIKNHVETNKKKIVIFDVGFQGSINLFIKYVIDRYIYPLGTEGKIETDIELCVGAEWSKELFEYRIRGDYFPFLNRIQLMSRSDELYHYKFGSLKSGKVKVTMGNKQWQHKAAVELVVLVMITQLTYAKE